MVKALARAFRWRSLLETGVHGTIGEIAAAEKINPSYASRVLRLTLLAPAIVETTLAGTPGPDVPLARLPQQFPVEWAGPCESLRPRHSCTCRIHSTLTGRT